MHDLIIRGGTIADGSGGDTRVGDVAVDGAAAVHLWNRRCRANPNSKTLRKRKTFDPAMNQTKSPPKWIHRTMKAN